ncbi:hypothetical protein M8C21_005894, partial [Ambrosia artemisiifolia]
LFSALHFSFLSFFSEAADLHRQTHVLPCVYVLIVEDRLIPHDSREESHHRGGGHPPSSPLNLCLCLIYCCLIYGDLIYGRQICVFA